MFGSRMRIIGILSQFFSPLGACSRALLGSSRHCARRHSDPYRDREGTPCGLGS